MEISTGASSPFSATGRQKDHDGGHEDKNHDFALTEQYAEHHNFVSRLFQSRLAECCFVNVLIRQEIYSKSPQNASKYCTG
ncbi:MAG: hypothetical protein A2Z25_19380 [Planctomycetes bacterium RBG_16_55_9]|nr:MAG: hypothetical protein A2Z25_19380 [Planctomycetes bacterium RBG_16_55_9]